MNRIEFLVGTPSNADLEMIAELIASTHCCMDASSSAARMKVLLFKWSIAKKNLVYKFINYKFKSETTGDCSM